jgi:hypothetical protein
MPTQTISFTVPLIPPSVNGYARHTKAGGHYQTAKALSFKEHVMFQARGCRVIAKAFKVEIGVFLGKGEKGDVDNFPKLVMDALAKAGVFCVPIGKSKQPCPQSDSYVYDLHVRKSRAVDGNGYTEITVTAL